MADDEACYKAAL
jgi:hypothetical protein